MTANSTETVCYLDRKIYICDLTRWTDINYTANGEIYQQYDTREVWLHQLWFNFQYYSTSL